jgi:hypothetical protein
VFAADALPSGTAITSFAVAWKWPFTAGGGHDWISATAYDLRFLRLEQRFHHLERIFD